MYAYLIISTLILGPSSNHSYRLRRSSFSSLFSLPLFIYPLYVFLGSRDTLVKGYVRFSSSFFFPPTSLPRWRRFNDTEEEWLKFLVGEEKFLALTAASWGGEAHGGGRKFKTESFDGLLYRKVLNGQRLIRCNCLCIRGISSG